MKSFILFLITMSSLALLGSLIIALKDKEMIRPVENSYLFGPVKEEPKVWYGTASWYGTGEDECIGCREDRRMNNGEFLNDADFTVAFNWLPFETWVKIINVDNGYEVFARVTDTGGFNELGRIVDMSKATKHALGCRDLCEVRVAEAL